MKIRNTFSVCPICLKRVSAVLKKYNDDIYLEKICDEHGFFSTITWRGNSSLFDFAAARPEINNIGACPDACGLCEKHLQTSCCVLLEITNHCNLSCPHCFAGSSQINNSPNKSLDEIKQAIAQIAKSGALLQLSGGEPTTREDLPEIISYAKSVGCKHVQLNSNGLRLAEDESFVIKLAEAGLSFVFMQFDGTNDNIYLKLRGQALLDKKLKAIELCGQHNIGVTLVPMVVPEVNEHDLGNIIKLAVKNSPNVRGVHFQPISYFANVDTKNLARITLPEILTSIYKQAKELVPADSLFYSRCDHPRCGFHGAFIVMPDGSLKAYSSRKAEPCCSSIVPAEKNREFVNLRWQRPAKSEPSVGVFEINSLDGFLARAKSHSFTISAMAFQDLYTMDLERLQQCSLHVYADGKIIPFCAYYNLNYKV